MMPHRLRLFLFPLCLVAAGCGTGGDYPGLLPTDVILAEPALPAHARDAASATGAAAVETDAAARAAALQRRAGALQAPVIEPELRARLQRAGS